MKPSPAAPCERRPSQVEGSVPTFALYCLCLLAGKHECVLFPWLPQVRGHRTGSEVGVPTARTVQTGPDSEPRPVVPGAQALGSLVQVSLPLGP